MARRTRSPDEWSSRLTASIGRQLAFYRGSRHLSTTELAERTAELGYSINRATITGIEIGRRSSVSIADVAILAEALGVSPLELLVPLSGPSEPYELLPGQLAEPWTALRWWRGDLPDPAAQLDRHPEETDDIDYLSDPRFSAPRADRPTWALLVLTKLMERWRAAGRRRTAALHARSSDPATRDELLESTARSEEAEQLFRTFRDRAEGAGIAVPVTPKHLRSWPADPPMRPGAESLSAPTDDHERSGSDG